MEWTLRNETANEATHREVAHDYGFITVEEWEEMDMPAGYIDYNEEPGKYPKEWRRPMTPLDFLQRFDNWLCRQHDIMLDSEARYLREMCSAAPKMIEAWLEGGTSSESEALEKWSKFARWIDETLVKRREIRKLRDDAIAESNSERNAPDFSTEVMRRWFDTYLDEPRCDRRDDWAARGFTYDDLLAEVELSTRNDDGRPSLRFCGVSGDF